LRDIEVNTKIWYSVSKSDSSLQDCSTMYSLNTKFHTQLRSRRQTLYTPLIDIEKHEQDTKAGRNKNNFINWTYERLLLELHGKMKYMMQKY